MIGKDSPLISVIVPIYNVEEYLPRCLESISNQSYKHIEIILVDDGATDSSTKIIQKYVQKDERMRAIHKTNGGLSSARNRAIQEAKGEYLTFIDADDYVANDYVEYLFNLLKNNNFKSQLAVCSLMNVYPESQKEKNMGNGVQETISGKKCIEMMCYHKLVDTCAYAKLGRRELYNDTFFPEGKLFEDIGSTYKLFEKCKTVECGFEPKYFYVIRKNSIVTSSFNLHKLDLLKMTDKMAESVNEIYPELKQATERRQVYARFSTLNQTLGEKNIKDIQNNLILFLKKHRESVLRDPQTPKRDHLAYCLLSFGLPLYKLSWQVYLKMTK